jgi:glutaredoxin
MKHRLTLYSRSDCCLCDEMKDAIRQVAARIPVDLKEVDVDRSPSIEEKYGAEVPVLFIDGRKAFKYRVTVRQLERRLRRRTLWSRLGLAKKWR